MKKVAVLMSTYNGMRFLPEQVESILSQKDVEVQLFVRDDGSSDGTVDYLSKFDDRLTLIPGKNLGVGNSFMQLVYMVPETYDYYAFSDQDDIWMQEKLAIAVNALDDRPGSCLYVSNQTLTDAGGKPIGNRYATAPDVSFRQILCQNMISGCTMVWNRELHVLLSDPSHRPDPELLRARIHDVWVAMAAAVTGEILYDDESHIYYRQHENNVVGVRRTPILSQWMDKVEKPELRCGRSRLAKETLRCFEDQIKNPEIRRQLHCYGFYKNTLSGKLRLLKDVSLIANTRESATFYRLKVLFNLF